MNKLAHKVCKRGFESSKIDRSFESFKIELWKKKISLLTKEFKVNYRKCLST